MDATANLRLPLIMPAQAQKHLTHNEAIEAIDALLHIRVADAAAITPPADPQEGLRVIVATGASGAFAGHAGCVAAFQSGAWRFFEPAPGWIVFLVPQHRFLAHDGAAWVALAEPVLSGLRKLGIDAAADDTNRLTLKSAAALFDHAGAGHQLKINKAAAGHIASLLFQTNYSGRAEMGLAGDDAFRVKVSADGAAWREAMRLDPATGDAILGNLRVSRDLQANLLPDSGRFAGNANNAVLSGIAFAAPSYLAAPGGGTLAAHAKFVADSADFGGSGAALNAELKALVEKTRAPAGRRYGPEWFVLRVTLGSPLAEPVAIAGESFGLALRNLAAALPARFTASYHLRVLSGRAAVAADAATVARAALDGAPLAREPRIVISTEGWRHVSIEGMPNAAGTDERAFQLLGTAGAQLLLALPRFVAGHAEPDPTQGILMNAHVFG